LSSNLRVCCGMGEGWSDALATWFPQCQTSARMDLAEQIWEIRAWIHPKFPYSTDPQRTRGPGLTQCKCTRSWYRGSLGISIGRWCTGTWSKHYRLLILFWHRVWRGLSSLFSEVSNYSRVIQHYPVSWLYHPPAADELLFGGKYRVSDLGGLRAWQFSNGARFCEILTCFHTPANYLYLLAGDPNRVVHRA
jgi:hypothetical protein